MKAKKILALILCFAMVLSTMSFNVFATDTVVAKIGEVPYETLAAAIEAANADDEIDLYADVEQIPTITKAITIDGNNHSVARSDDGQFGTISGTVTLKNLVYTDGTQAIRTNYSTTDYTNMTLVIENCTFNDVTGWAIMGGSTGTNPEKTLGALTVTGCTFNAGATNENYMIYAQSVNTLNVSGCIFNGEKVTKGAIHTGDSTAQATVATISGNEISGVARGVQVGNRVEGSSASISGNTFNNITTAADAKAGAVYIHKNSDAATTRVIVSSNEFSTDSVILYNDEKTLDNISEMLTFTADNTQGDTAITDLKTAGTEVTVTPSASGASATVESMTALVEELKTAGSEITVGAVLTVAEGETFNIDLNGCTVKMGANYIENNGTLNIKNGSVIADTTNDETNGAPLWNKGTMNVDADVTGVIAAIRQESGTLTVNGGNLTVTNTNGVTTNHIIRVKGGEAIVNGGDFRGNQTANGGGGCMMMSWTGGKITINGGNFDNFNIYGNAIFGMGGAVATIKGGKFTNVLVEGTSIADCLKSFLAEGYTVNENGEVVDASVAKINGKGYATLAEAIDAAEELGGEVTVTLAADVAEKIEINEAVGFYLTLEGADKTITGKITINPLSDTNDNRRITINNVNFVNTDETAVYFITATKDNHYPRLTVENCDFTGNGKDTDVAIRTKSAYDLIIKDCTGKKLHSFLQNTSGVKVTVRNVTVTESKGGLALGTAQNVTVRGCELTTRTYGIRLDAVLDTTATLNGNIVSAYIPVSVREATATEYMLTFTNGNSDYTATNPDNVWCAICGDEYEDDRELNEATGNVKIINYVDGLTDSGVYGAYEWPVTAVYSDGFSRGFDTLKEAMGFGYSAGTQEKIVVHKDITESMNSLEGNITTDNPDGVTIKNTIAGAWIFCSENFTIGEGVTYDATGADSGLFMYAENAVINGIVLTDCYYQRYKNTKLTINEPGSMTVKTETFILRYTDGDGEAGVYVVGDNNDLTIGLDAAVIYFYQGMINAKDADIKVGTYRQRQTTDANDVQNAGPANLVLDNTNMVVTVNEHSFEATGNSTVTLTNGSVLDCAGGFEAAEGAVAIDGTSKIIAKGKELDYPRTAKVSDYDELLATLANTEIDDIEFANDITVPANLNVSRTVTIDGCGYAIDYTNSGDAARVITVLDTANGASLTVKNLDINFVGGWTERGINYNTNGTLTLENVKVNGENVNYAVNLPGSSAGAKVVITDSELTAAIPLNIWGTDVNATVIDSELIVVDETTVESYAAVAVNNGADNTNVTVTGGKIYAMNGSVPYRNYGVNSTVTISGTTEVTTEDKPIESIVVAKVAYKGSTQHYSYANLKDAVAKAENDPNATVVLLNDTEVNESIMVTGAVTVDLNGKKITGPDVPATKSYYAFIVDDGNMTLQDTSVEQTGEIRAKCYGVETKSGSFTMESGKITATNNKTLGAAIVNYGGTVTINGGTLDSAVNAVFTAGYFSDAETLINKVTITNGDVSVYDYGETANYTEAVTSASNTYETVEGYVWVKNSENLYELIPTPELPTATVTNIKNDELTFALNFKADEANEAQLAYYGDWYADFELTVNKKVTFNANGGADGYLSGQYDEWNENWVNVPFEDVTLEANSSLKIMEYASKLMDEEGLKLTYNDVYSFVKDFNCGVFFEEKFLAENPELEVTLELRMYNPTDESESYTIGETYEFDASDIEKPVAAIGEKKFTTLEAAIADAKDNDTIALIWNEGNAPIVMSGSVYGKSVTITGTAKVDWSKGNLFVGRGGAGDGKVIFDNANLTSASNQSATGIHVSGREKDTNNKYDGTLILKDSNIELDYLINKGTMTLDNSTLTVKNGFSVGGRPASETESGEDATATITLKNNSKVVVDNHNGMGIGYEAIGVMNVESGSTFEYTQNFLITEKGTMNVNGGKVIGNNVTLTNNGTINVSGESDIAANVTGEGLVYMNGVTMSDDTKLVGAKVRFASGTNNIDGSVIDDGFFQVGIGAYNGTDNNVDTENGVVVNVKNNAKIGSNGNTYACWIGTGFYDTDTEKAAAMTNAKYVLNINNSVAEFGYLHISNDGELNVNGNAAEKAHYNNSEYSFYGGDFIINGTATFDNTDVLALYTKVSCDNGTDKPGTLNIKNGTEYEAERHNGAIDGINFILYKTGVANVDEASELHIGECTSIATDAVMNIGGKATALGTITNNGTINLTTVNATITTPEAPTVKSTVEDYEVVYADGKYSLKKIEEVELFEFYGSNAVLGNSLSMDFYVADANLEGTNYYAEIKHYAEDRVITTQIPYSEWEVASTGYHKFSYSNLAAKQIADKLEVAIFTTDGIQVSATREDGLRAYAFRAYAAYAGKADLSDSNSKLLTAVTDMLNYGAAAQVEFNYNTNNLANAGTETYQQYATATTPQLEDIRVKDDNVYGTNVTLKDNIILSGYFADVTSDMYAKITFYDHYGNLYDIGVEYSEFKPNGSYYQIDVDELAIADAGVPVTITVYTADGTKHSEVVESVNSYLCRAIKAYPDKTIFAEIAEFAASALAALNN